MPNKELMPEKTMRELLIEMGVRVADSSGKAFTIAAARRPPDARTVEEQTKERWRAAGSHPTRAMLDASCIASASVPTSFRNQRTYERIGAVLRAPETTVRVNRGWPSG